MEGLLAPGGTGGLFARKLSVVSFQLSGEKGKRSMGRQAARGTFDVIIPPGVETLGSCQGITKRWGGCHLAAGDGRPAF
jgi:hypothetical protein